MCALNLLILLLICIMYIVIVPNGFLMNSIFQNSLLSIHCWLINFYCKNIYLYILSYLNEHYSFYVSRTIDNN